MKAINIGYWVTTGLITLFFLPGAVANAMTNQDSIEFIGGLGYPTYIIGFLGVAKILGVIALWIPGFPRVREWAYAGLFFDLLGAGYSNFMVKGNLVDWLPLVPAIGVLMTSYFLYHKRREATTH